MKANATTTEEHINTYLQMELMTHGLLSKYVSYMLEFNFGEDIHKQIDGFIHFAKSDSNIDEMAIKNTLMHDIGGAMRNDKLMLPRVSAYGKFSQKK